MSFQVAIKLSKPEEKDYEVSYDDGADAIPPLPKYPDPSNGAKEGYVLYYYQVV